MGLDLDLVLDVSMDLGDGPADTDGPMLSFLIPEHDGAGMDLDHALPSPD